MRDKGERRSTQANTPDDRLALVRQLVSATIDPSDATRQLASFGWDWDGAQVQLVPYDIHDATKHTGGVAVSKRGP